jgi:serine/threonine-protein kinase HipA
VSDGIAVYVAVGEKNVLAGRMYPHRRRGTESASFAYDDRYLADPDAYALDPGLPLVTGTLQTRVGRAAFGAFADSSPDRWGRTLIQRAEQARAEAERPRAEAAAAAPGSMSEVDVLLGVRDDLRQGALRFRLEDQGPFLATEESGVPILTDLPALLDIAARAERDTAGYEDLTRLLRAGSSLGGARPKAHVLDASGRVAIAKFPSASKDTWNVMAWEKVALDLARDAGLRVPDSQLIRIADRSVLVVERFDRRGAARVGYASAMTMLEANAGDQRSYLEIAAVIEQRSAAATADLRQLWRRIAFSILISNTDDHLRNHGFLHERGDSWMLSPAFDLNPDPRPGSKHLSTAIDYTDRRASVDTLLRVADYFRLDASQAVEVLAGVTQAVARWRAAAKACGLMQADLDLMKPAFEHAEGERARALTKIWPARAPGVDAAP